MILFLKPKYSSFILNFIFQGLNIEPNVEAVQLSNLANTVQDMNKKLQVFVPCHPNKRICRVL